ncbi:MAG TPA: hypothetical protein GX717_09640, partial [Clostridiaceae bacterium]|nr:hypothetical protein [Clostridiaceae bacterium]
MTAAPNDLQKSSQDSRNSANNQRKNSHVNQRSTYKKMNIVILILVVVILLSVLVLFSIHQDSDSGSPVSSSETTQKVAATTDNMIREEGSRSEEPDSSTDLVNSFAAPTVIEINELTEIELPAAWQTGPFEVLYDWPDGTILLSAPHRLSLFDPAIGGEAGETVLVTADYGVQAAANNSYVVYGVGGDEVWEL